MLITAWFVKVRVTSQKHQSACGVGAGTKCRQELSEQGPPGWFVEDAAGQQDGALGNVVGWGLCLLAHPELRRGFLTLTLDLCHCCTRVFGSASHPSISSPGHPVTGDMEQAVQGLGREVTRHTNELQHPLLEKKTIKKSRFPVYRSKEEAFCNFRNFRPWCLLFSALGTCSLSPGWMQLALTTFSFLTADSSQPPPLLVFNPESIAEIN